MGGGVIKKQHNKGISKNSTCNIIQSKSIESAKVVTGDITIS